MTESWDVKPCAFSLGCFQGQRHEEPPDVCEEEEERPAWTQPYKEDAEGAQVCSVSPQPEAHHCASQCLRDLDFQEIILGEMQTFAFECSF